MLLPNAPILIIPKSIKVIEDHAFYHCTYLDYLTLQEGLQEIQAYAFANCSSSYFRSLEIPNTVKLLGDHAFYGCTNIQSISFRPNLAEIPSYAFAECTSLTRINLPENIETINDHAFYHCSRLMYINLGEVKAIGKYSFAECT